MKKHKKTTLRAKLLRRLTAATVGLLLLLSACSVQNTADPDVSSEAQSVAGSEVSSLLSETEATSSGTGHIGTQEPILPDERATTVELLTSYPLGDDGIPYYLQYESDPSYAQVVLAPVEFFADEKGKVYYFNGGRIVCLQDGANLLLPSDERLSIGFVAFGDKIYSLLYDGRLITYTMENGRESCVQITTEEYDYKNLFLTSNGAPMVRCDEILYDANGNVVSDAFALARESGEETFGAMTVQGKQYSYTGFTRILGNVGNTLALLESQQHQYENRDSVQEVIYYQYDAQGNPLSEFMLRREAFPNDPQACSIFEGDVECTSYCPSTVTVGGQSFENVLATYEFMGADGTFYLLLVYPDGGDLYRIIPGYSDVKLTNFEEEQAETSVASGDAEISATASSATHIDLAPNVAKRRAQNMINMTWTVRSWNKEIRGAGELPNYVEAASVGDTLQGIPYCYGGFNGLDSIDVEDSSKRYRYYVYTLAAGSESLSCMAGNINHDGFIGYTCGLDCSGFVCSAYGLTTKRSTSGLSSYGHQIEGIDNLQSMDLIVQAGVHCYLFYSKVDASTLLVYDCTGAAEDSDHKTNFRRISTSSLENYEFRRPFYSYSYNSSQHWYSCADCNVTGEAEDHRFSYYTSVSNTYHSKLCKECGCLTTEAHRWMPMGGTIMCELCYLPQPSSTSASENPVDSEAPEMIYVDIERRNTLIPVANL